MNIEKMVDLSKFTSLKVGGIAENFYRPQNLDELKTLTASISDFNILGAGSNLLIDDQSKFEHVIYMGDYEKELLTVDQEGIIKVSSSINIQKLLNFSNKHGYGGAEYLYSLPAMMGGIVAMNAGRGKTFNKSISDYVLSVDVVENGVFKTVKRDECGFKYRMSDFLSGNSIIHGISLKFEEVSVEEGKQKINERMDFVKKNQALSLPNAGSVFKQCNYRIMKITRLMPKNKKGLYFSEKTLNWISNGGKGTYNEALKLINRTKFFHKIFRKDVELEWQIWSNR